MGPPRPLDASARKLEFCVLRFWFLPSSFISVLWRPDVHSALGTSQPSIAILISRTASLKFATLDLVPTAKWILRRDRGSVLHKFSFGSKHLLSACRNNSWDNPRHLGHRAPVAAPLLDPLGLSGRGVHFFPPRRPSLAPPVHPH